MTPAVAASLIATLSPQTWRECSCCGLRNPPTVVTIADEGMVSERSVKVHDGCPSTEGIFLATLREGETYGLLSHDDARDALETIVRLARELDEARAIIEGSMTPPTDAEITAHAAAGGAWLVTLPARRGVRLATETRYTNDPKEVSRLWWSEGARWVAVLDGRPCARQKVSDGR